MSTAPRPNLLPIAAFVSLLVLLLGATGLFALHHTHAKIAADLARLESADEILVTGLRTRAAFKTQVQEWKNILLRGHDPKDLATYRANFETQEKIVHDGLVALQQNARLDAPGSAGKSLDLVAEHARLGEAYRSALAAFDPAQPGAPVKADAAVRGLDRPLSEQLDLIASGVEQTAASERQAISERAAARYEALRRITWIVASFAVLAALWLCLRATRLAA